MRKNVLALVGLTLFVLSTPYPLNLLFLILLLVGFVYVLGVTTMVEQKEQCDFYIKAPKLRFRLDYDMLLSKAFPSNNFPEFAMISAALVDRFIIKDKGLLCVADMISFLNEARKATQAIKPSDGDGCFFSYTYKNSILSCVVRTIPKGALVIHLTKVSPV